MKQGPCRSRRRFKYVTISSRVGGSRSTSLYAGMMTLKVLLASENMEGRGSTVPVEGLTRWLVDKFRLRCRSKRVLKEFK